MPDPANGKVQVVVRRRRTHRHRRNRRIRRLCLAAAVSLVAASASIVALSYLGPSLFRARQTAPSTFEESETSRDQVTLNNVLSQAQPSRPVYPYSVVPGGVEDAKELKWVAEHDPIVAAHYAGFDYAHAQVVRLTLARTVYMSYRIGNRVYWMRHRVRLHKGEKLITDGRMTARGRCANRVEEKPQQQASPNEPAPEAFDKPVQSGEGTAMRSPEVPFQSALLNRPPTPGFDPGGPLSLYNPFTGGSGLAISPPPLPLGVCGPVPVKNGGTGRTTSTSGSNGKKKPGPCGSTGTPSPVPEPATWVMLISGLAAIGWQARRKHCRA